MFIVSNVLCVFLGYFEAMAELTEEAPFKIQLGIIKPRESGAKSYDLDEKSQPYKFDCPFHLYAVVCWGKSTKMMNTREW